MSDLGSVDVAMAVLRVWVGVVMVLHGSNHLRTLEGTSRWFASKGFRSAGLLALGSGVGEVLAGAALIVGFLTSIAAAGVVTTMTIAFWVIHRPAGFFVFRRPDEGWEYVATLAVAAGVTALAGPGALSIDNALGIATRLDGLVGVLLVVGGVALSALLLLVGWRRPVPEDGGEK